METFLRDLRLSLRSLRRAPGFTAVAILALALGIAANTAIFSVVNTVLLRPYAYRDPDRMVMFQNTFRRAPRTGSASPVEFNWWRRQTGFQDVSAYSFNTANLTGESLAEQIPIMRVSAAFFDLCGIHAAYGRTFTAADDVPHASRTVVLAHSFWRSHFAGNPAAVGKYLTLGGERYEIIGVTGAGIQGGEVAEQSLLTGDLEIDEPPDVYIPYQLDPDSGNQGHSLNVAGRLKPGVSLAAANQQLQAGYPEYARRWTGLTPGAGFAVESFQRAIVGGVSNSLLILLGAVSLVLLIACANVANLMLARASARRHEFAICAALGASRGRMVRQLLTEALLVSFAGGTLGLAAGYAAVRALLTISPAIPRIGAAGANVTMDWHVVAFTLGVSLFTSIVFGLVPALESSRASLIAALQETGSRGGSGWRHARARRFLVTGQMSLSVVLLIGAALLIRSFIALGQVNPGFDVESVLTMRMSITGPQFADPVAVARVFHEGLRRIRALPGVAAATAACCVPLDGRLQVGFQILGRTPGESSGGVTGWTEVSSGYFETFQIPIARGRAFTEKDEDGDGAAVTIINAALARRFWPASDPLNAQIVIGDSAPLRVIGIAADLHDRGLHREPRPTLYVPSVSPGGLLRMMPWAWAIRTRVPPLTLVSAVRKELREASGGLPVGNVRTMHTALSRSRAAGDFNTLVLVIFAACALLLAALGVYGLMAHSVAQRQREIGIRLALGAESGQIRNMVVLQGLRLAVLGAIFGVLAASGLTRWMAGFLFGVTPWDPLAFAVVPAILAGVALAAAWLPASRASRVDAASALRCQ